MFEEIQRKAVDTATRRYKFNWIISDTFFL